MRHESVSYGVRVGPNITAQAHWHYVLYCPQRSVWEGIDLLLQLPVHGRHRGAPNPRAMEVLERRE